MAKDDEDLPLIVELKAAIRGAGLSYSELARQSGVAHSQISRFMGGKTITAITAARLFRHFGLQVSGPIAADVVAVEGTDAVQADVVMGELVDAARPQGKRK